MNDCVDIQFDIQDWFEVAKALNYSHMILAFNFFSSEYYPLYTKSLKDFINKYEHTINKLDEVIVAVYDLNKNMAEQLCEPFPFNFPANFLNTL